MIYTSWPTYVVVAGVRLPLFPPSSVSYFSSILLADGTLSVSMNIHGLREIRKDSRWEEKK